MQSALQIPLPTLPTIAVRLIQLFDDPHVDLQDVLDVLRSDPAIAAKILKAANSSAYGVGREITDLQQAITLLGRTVVTSLALSFSLAEKSMQTGNSALLFRRYWLQSMTQALTAECLAKRFAKPKAGEWFITGLLASVGRLSLISHDPELYEHTLSHSESCQIPLCEAEEALFGTTADTLSAELLTAWNFPSRCVDAVANQHRMISDEDMCRTASKEPLAAAIATATAVSEYFCQNCQGQALVHIVHLMEQAFDASEDEVARLIDSVHNRLDATSDLFQVDCSSLGSATELMSLAMQHLSSLAVAQSNPHPACESLTRLAQQNERLLKCVQRLTKKSTTDALTGLFNRGYFDDSFRQQAISSVQSQREIGVVMVDIDYFKRINDTFGHPVGDEVLKHVAAVIRQNVRPSDLVARYGGEEFVVMLPEVDIATLEMISERIRDAIEAGRCHVEGDTIQVTVSAGAATGCPSGDVGSFCKRLIAVADRQLYASKSQGRNRVCIASPTSDLRSTDTVSCSP